MLLDEISDPRNDLAEDVFVPETVDRHHYLLGDSVIFFWISVVEQLIDRIAMKYQLRSSKPTSFPEPSAAARQLLLVSRPEQLVLGGGVQIVEVGRERLPNVPKLLEAILRSAMYRSLVRSCLFWSG